MLSLLLVPALVLGLLALTSMFRYRRLSHIDGPAGFPIIGSAYRFLGCNTLQEVWEVLKEESYKHTHAFKFWMGMLPVIVCKDPATIKTVNCSPHCLDKGSIMSFFNVLTNGVFVATGRRWEEFRKLVNLSMGPRLLEEYIEVFNVKTSQLVDKLATEEGKFIDPLIDVANVSADIAFNTHWGVDSDLLHYDKLHLQENFLKHLEALIHRAVRPHLYPDFVFKLTPSYRELKSVTKEGLAFLSEKVEERKAKRALENKLPEGDPRKRKTVFLDMMADLCASRGKTDPNYIQMNSADILIAASDTTSAVFCQTLYHVAADQEIQEKLREEVDSLFPGEGIHVTKEDIKKLVYMEMILKETLRIYSPPNTFRYVAKDIQSEVGLIPAGTTFASCHYQVHRNPAYWERPDEFYPDHFTEEAQLKRPKGVFLSFLTGPRNCPGKIYAYWLMKVMLAHIIKRFKIETDMKDVKQKIYFIVVPANGFSLRFSPRK